MERHSVREGLQKRVINPSTAIINNLYRSRLLNSGQVSDFSVVCGDQTWKVNPSYPLCSLNLLHESLQ